MKVTLAARIFTAASYDPFADRFDIHKLGGRSYR
jgi:hypothetical protein